MTLRELMGNGAPEVEVSGLAYSTQSVTPGTLFFASPGSGPTATTSLRRPSSAGRWRWCASARWASRVPEVVVPDVRAAMGPAAARFHGDPTAELDVIGITGTNGKTTTAFLARHLLEAAGRRSGLLGTVKRVVGGVEEDVERTTPEAIDLQATFRRMVDAGDSACVMEVSSHALELGRAAGIRFACRVFTNLTQDHLDFHPSMDAYFAAKRRLFEGPGTSIVNLDDPWGRKLAAELDCVTFAIERDADYRAREVRFDLAGSTFVCETPDGSRELRSRLPGVFNVQNVLAAVAAVRSLGVPLDTVAEALPRFERVPGRFEPVDEGQDFGLLVDYAHTPDSLENVLRAARELTSGTARGGVRRRRRPRPRQAAADGRRGAAAGRPRDRDLGQPPERGSRARSSTR